MVSIFLYVLGQQPNHPTLINHTYHIMKISMKISLILSAFFFSNVAWAASSGHRYSPQNFQSCLITHHSNSSISEVIYTPDNPSYTPILQLKLNNPRFSSPSTPRPLLIVTPVHESQIQSVIYCSKKLGVEMRIRGGGHDFEGLSYTANVPFVMLDLINMRSINVDAATKTAWVQGGASLGELYYRISEKSNMLGFPAGDWSTVGVGGHISGGGYGTLMRKYGLAADNVIDVRVINHDGQILNRKTMGEDIFWAIRGGGGSSFGVIVDWKLRLVDVPEIVTVFVVRRTLEQNATNLLHKWQYVAPNADKDLFLRAQLTTVNSSTNGGRTVLVTFDALFLGRIDRLISLLDMSFPELGVVREDCIEVSWIQSALVFAGFSSQGSPQTFLNRTAPPRLPVKGKTDYVQKPISINGLEGMWEMLFQTDIGSPVFILNPYGGKMSEISESAIPFPHRAGNLYMMLEMVLVDPTNPSVIERRTNWIRSFFHYMARYVSRSPRRAYVNYNDLDLGVGTRTYTEASIWGTRYFSHNFERLVRAKSIADPENFFKHPQSIPSFSSFVYGI